MEGCTGMPLDLLMVDDSPAGIRLAGETFRETGTHHRPHSTIYGVGVIMTDESFKSVPVTVRSISRAEEDTIASSNLKADRLVIRGGIDGS